MKFSSIFDNENGIRTVVCEGHVDRVEFAKLVDTDDIAEILGDNYKSQGSYPTTADKRQIAGMARHSWGKWTVQGEQRFWEEVHKTEPGAKPFTIVSDA